MNEMEKNRKIISETDEQMAGLFEKRMNAARTIAEFKREFGLPVTDTEREKQLLAANRKYISDPEIEEYYVEFLKNTIKISREYQTRLINGRKVAYSGVEGAFAYIAAKKLIPEGEYIACKDFTEAYRGVENGEFDCAVLPVENSGAGEVGEVVDLIFSGNLFVNGIIEQPIHHNLLGVKGAKLSDIKTVISHPQALSQCAGFIHDHSFETLAYTNTAAAAKAVFAGGDKSVAAIASDETAGLFGLDIIEREINDNLNNTTRFAVLSRSLAKPQAPADKNGNESSILMFTVQNRAGALAQTLNIIGAHGYNMKSLRSRPMQGLQWNYYFYIEVEGDLSTPDGRDMITELSALCARLKYVGTYFSYGK